jgi:dihydroorotase-like cyclic amidohydrolase
MLFLITHELQTSVLRENFQHGGHLPFTEKVTPHHFSEDETTYVQSSNQYFIMSPNGKYCALVT